MITINKIIATAIPQPIKAYRQARLSLNANEMRKPIMPKKKPKAKAPQLNCDFTSSTTCCGSGSIPLLSESLEALNFSKHLQESAGHRRNDGLII